MQVFEVMTQHDGYAAIHGRAALGELAPMGRLAVSGRDRASYLQGLLTNDIQALTAGTGCYAAWLTPQGRMISDVHVFESGDMILLEVPAALTGDIMQRLDHFIFTEDVQLGDLSEALAGVSLHGPAAAAVLRMVLGGEQAFAGWAPYANARLEWSGSPIVVARVDQLGVPGYRLYVDRTRETELRTALAAVGAVPADPEAVSAARVEAGYPLFGVDMDGDTIPLEAGIEERAISFSKGCYVGQEVIIRVLHRGGGRVARKLVALRFEADVPPGPGTRLVAAEREIGSVTSSALSPSQGAIGMGYVHRDFVAAGTRVDFEAGAGRLPAVVSARPLTSAS